jgi:hypothetical protein
LAEKNTAATAQQYIVPAGSGLPCWIALVPEVWLEYLYLLKWVIDVCQAVKNAGILIIGFMLILSTLQISGAV